MAPYVSDLSTFTTWGLRPPALMQAQSELTPFPSINLSAPPKQIDTPPASQWSLFTSIDHWGTTRLLTVKPWATSIG